MLKADIYDSTLNPAREEDLSHLAFLQMMVQDEIERRETKKLQQRIAKALWIFFAILLLLATAADLPAETLSPGFLSISTRKTVCAPSRIMT